MTDTRKKLLDVMEGFGTAMLVSKTNERQLTARPMAVARMEENGEMWFATEKNSGKVADIEHDPNVAVTFQSRNQFVSVSGTAEVVDDSAKIDELWSETWKVWFPKGKDDPSLTLLHVVPSGGEYWDNSGFVGLKYLVNAGIAYFQGEKAAPDSKVNASATL